MCVCVCVCGSVLLSVCLCVCLCAQSLTHVKLIAAPYAVAHQAPLSREFSRQEYWSGLPFPPPWNLPNTGIKPVSPALAADFLPLSHLKSPLSLDGGSPNTFLQPFYKRGQNGQGNKRSKTTQHQSCSLCKSGNIGFGFFLLFASLFLPFFLLCKQKNDLTVF